MKSKNPVENINCGHLVSGLSCDLTRGLDGAKKGCQVFYLAAAMAL
jgi:hypothetical protein